MLNEIFKIKFPFTYNYFETLLELVLDKKRKFPQGIILEGADSYIQYLFALELARILNCQGDKTSSCDCVNCKWIKSFTHPCINSISQIHFKPEDDETKTLISVKQAREIEKSLLLSSDYHRFFIFFSSKETDNNLDKLKDFKTLGYNDFNYSIEPINPKILSETVANSLLKSIEEPPERTTFVFLSKTKEDILQTIVSRCQTFKLSGFPENVNYNDILNIVQYPISNYTNAINFSDNIQAWIKENNSDIIEFLNKFMVYLKDLLKQNVENSAFAMKIQNDIDIINKSLKHSRASMSDKVVLEAMTLRLVRGY